MRDNYALKLIIAPSFGCLLMIFPHGKVVFSIKCRLFAIRWELMDSGFVSFKIKVSDSLEIKFRKKIQNLNLDISLKKQSSFHLLNIDF